MSTCLSNYRVKESLVIALLTSHLLSDVVMSHDSILITGLFEIWFTILKIVTDPSDRQPMINQLIVSRVSKI